MKPNQKILLFIPMYNCEKQIGRVLSKCNAGILSKLSEILIVDNGSSDKSREVASHWAESCSLCPVKVVRNTHNVSLGGSHKVAFNYSIDNGFDYCIVLHGDDQGTIQDLFKVLDSERFGNYDAWLGARFHPKSRLVGYSASRIFGNRVVNSLMSIATQKKVLDIGSGLNMYLVSSLKSRFYMRFPNSLNFNIFMILYQIYKKQTINFFPITWREEDQVSNAKMWKQGLQILKWLAIYVISPNHVFKCDNSDPSLDYSFEVVNK